MRADPFSEVLDEEHVDYVVQDRSLDPAADDRWRKKKRPLFEQAPFVVYAAGGGL